MWRGIVTNAIGTHVAALSRNRRLGDRARDDLGRTAVSSIPDDAAASDRPRVETIPPMPIYANSGNPTAPQESTNSNLRESADLQHPKTTDLRQPIIVRPATTDNQPTCDNR